MELRITSVAFCNACHNGAPVSMRVDNHTPPHLLWRRNGSRISSRVAGVRPVKLTWTTPTTNSMLVDRSNTKLQQLLKKVNWADAIGTLIVLSPTCLKELTWPRYLLWLTLGGNFNVPLHGIAWPQQLLRLEFGKFFNQPIAGIEWPELQQLTFGLRFDKPIVDVSVPKLERLELGSDFNQPIEGVSWPELKHLQFRHKHYVGLFNQPIVSAELPKLEELRDRKSVV